MAILKAGISISLYNIVTVSLFLLLSFEKYDWLDYLMFSGYGFLSAMFSTVLTIGMLPFFLSQD